MSPERSNHVVLVGIAALVAGAVLPWIVRNPSREGVSLLVHLPGMDSGLELWGLLTLSLTVLAAFALLRSGPRTTLALAGTGTVSAFLALRNLATYGVGGMFVPGPGVYLTLIGGLLLIVAVTGTPRPPASYA